MPENTPETKGNLTEGSEQEWLKKEPNRKETNNDEDLMQVQIFNIHE